MLRLLIHGTFIFFQHQSHFPVAALCMCFEVEWQFIRSGKFNVHFIEKSHLYHEREVPSTHSGNHYVCNTVLIITVVFPKLLVRLKWRLHWNKLDRFPTEFCVTCTGWKFLWDSNFRCKTKNVLSKLSVWNLNTKYMGKIWKIHRNFQSLLLLYNVRCYARCSGMQPNKHMCILSYKVCN
jgi:hypothetical protein